MSIKARIIKWPVARITKEWCPTLLFEICEKSNHSSFVISKPVGRSCKHTVYVPVDLPVCISFTLRKVAISLLKISKVFRVSFASIRRIKLRKNLLHRLSQVRIFFYFSTIEEKEIFYEYSKHNKSIIR